MSYLDLLQKYYGEVRGGEYWMCCPYHNESKPSMSVNINEGQFYCFGCHERGWIDKLIAQKEGISRSEAMQIVTQAELGGRRRNGQRVEYNYLSEDILDDFFMLQSKEYLQYIRSRGLTRTAVKEFDLREGGSHDRFWSKRVIYAIRNLKGQIASIEGRAIDKKVDLRHYNAPGSKAAYGLFGADRFVGYRYKWLFVVEGPFDCMSVVQSGDPAVAMCTSTLSDEQYRILEILTDHPIVILDGIKPGTERAREDVVNILHKGLSTKFPNSYTLHTIRRKNTDPNDLLKKGTLKKYLTDILREKGLRRKNNGTKKSRKARVGKGGVRRARR